MGVKRRRHRFSTVRQETRADNTGCNEWNGTYTVIRDDGGNWRIDATNVHASAVRG